MMINDEEIRSLWIAAGGKFHGPHVETGTMPESHLLPFLRNFLEKAVAFDAIVKHRLELSCDEEDIWEVIRETDRDVHVSVSADLPTAVFKCVAKIEAGRPQSRGDG